MPYLDVEAHTLTEHLGARAAVKVTLLHPGSIPFTVDDARNCLVDDVESTVVRASTPMGTLRLTMTAHTIVTVEVPE